MHITPPGLPNIPVWDREEWTPLAPLRGEVEADVCVVGLGGSGLSCLAELLDLGCRAVGVDAASVGAGAAGRNGGFLLAGMAAFYHDAAAELGRARARRVYELTLEQIDRIAAEAPEAVRRVGSLRIAASAEEERDCEAQLRAMRDDDLPVEAYQGPEGRGLLFPRDGAFDPLLRCRLLARRVVARGAMLFERTPALAVASGEVRTPEGRVRCGQVIVAVDGALERILPELGDQVRTARLQMLATAPTREILAARPVYFRWGYEYWQQLADGAIVLGGFRDRCGDQEWTTTAEPSEAAQSMLESFLRGHLGVQAPITHRWAGCVSYSRGALPLLVEARRGVWAIGGYSGTGNVLGALCGRAVAQTVVNGASPLSVVADG